MRILVIIFCFFIGELLAQNNLNNPFYVWKSSHFPSKSVNESSKHNFNPYEQYSEGDSAIHLLKTNCSDISMFIVFINNGGDKIASLTNGQSTLEIKEDKVFFDKNFPYKATKNVARFISFTGLFESPIFQNSSYKFKINFDKPSLPTIYNEVAEFVYFNRLLSSKEQHIWESYFALKYGVSLQKYESYVNSSGSEIWTKKNNEKYLNRLGYIGRDDKINLYQKQGTNVEDDFGLVLGLNNIEIYNKANNSSISNGNYVIWSDNNGQLEFPKQAPDSIISLMRFWKMKNNLDATSNDSIQFSADFSKIKDYQPNANYNLVIADAEEDLESTQVSKFRMAFDGNMGKMTAKVPCKVFKNLESFFTFQIVPDNSNTFIRISKDNGTTGAYKIYPNPVSTANKLNILTKGFEDKNFSIKIFNNTGSQLDEFNNNSEALENAFEYQFKMPGIYYIKIITDSTYENIKVVVI